MSANLLSIRKIPSYGFFMMFFSSFFTKNSVLMAENLSISSPSEEAMIEMIAGVNEIQEYETICGLLEQGSLEEAAEKIIEFRKKYPISTYENRFAAIHNFFEYKKIDDKDEEEEKEDVENKKFQQEEALSQLNASPEIAAYCYYLHGVNQQEMVQLSSFQKKILGFDETMLQQEMSAKAFKTLKEFLRQYPNHPFACDVQQRMKMLHHRLANIRLLQACIYFEKKAYVAAINIALTTVKEYPESFAAIQSLFLAGLGYEQLKLPTLAEKMFAIYRLNRPQLVHLEPQTSVKNWYKIAEKHPQAFPTALEKEAEPIQTQFKALEKRAKTLENKVEKVLQQQKHTVESALESQKKLGVIKLLTTIKESLNVWLEFQILEDYPSLCDTQKESINALFNDLFDNIATHLNQLESYLKSEEERFKDQEKTLSLASIHTLSLPFFDAAIEQSIEKNLTQLTDIKNETNLKIDAFKSQFFIEKEPAHPQLPPEKLLLEEKVLEDDPVENL